MSAPLDFYCPVCEARAGELCQGHPLGGSTHAARNPTPRRIRDLPGQGAFFAEPTAGRCGRPSRGKVGVSRSGGPTA